jgi:PhoPQ-activated pathogenicity-related protein
MTLLSYINLRFKYSMITCHLNFVFYVRVVLKNLNVHNKFSDSGFGFGSGFSINFRFGFGQCIAKKLEFIFFSQAQRILQPYFYLLIM